VGHYISPGLRRSTYANLLAVDFFLAQRLFGADFNPESIGGAGWRDGLLVFHTLTALAVMYANWRSLHAGGTRLIGFGQQTGGHALDWARGHLKRHGGAGR